MSLAMLLPLSVSGCGAGSYSKSAATTEAVAEEWAYDTSASAGGGMFLNDGEVSKSDAGEAGAPEDKRDGQMPEAAEVSRKLIKNVNLDVETETFDSLLAALWEKTEAFGGYIEESYTYNGSRYNENRRRNANLSIRIPARRLEEFLSEVSALSNVVSRNESVTDVTLQYVDLESHKKALLAEQERLLELLARAETIEDIISLESRLSEVRCQIESMESQLRTMDNQVSFSTVNLNVNEVTKLTPVKEQSPWEKISTGFVRSLNDIGTGFVNFGIGFMINLPYLLLWAVIGLLAFFPARMVYRKRIKGGHLGEKEKKGSLGKKGPRGQEDMAAGEVLENSCKKEGKE